MHKIFLNLEEHFPKILRDNLKTLSEMDIVITNLLVNY